MTVDICQTDLDRLKIHTEACWPEEACALLVGRPLRDQHWIVKRVELAKNIAENTNKSFEIDPSLRIKIEMNTLSEADEIIGVFHSHPEGDASLSRTDIQSMKEPNLFWLIASTDAGTVKEFCAFAAAGEKSFTQLSLQTVSAVTGD
jgi:proteasome lid subunit RPN8/RPN11